VTIIIGEILWSREYEGLSNKDNVRKARDDREFVRDLAALLFHLLLCGSELIFRGSRLECDLWPYQ
jgi:hypothetical protein